MDSEEVPSTEAKTTEDNPSPHFLPDGVNPPESSAQGEIQDFGRAGARPPPVDLDESGFASAQEQEPDNANDPGEVVSLPRRHHVAPALISLDRIDEDDTFRIRAEGEVDLLATDIARVGQLFPVDLKLKPPDRFQRKSVV